jgi:hypothetical protein
MVKRIHANERSLKNYRADFTVIQVYPPNATHWMVPNTIVSASLSLAVDISTVSTRTFTVRGMQTGIYVGTYTTGSLRFDPAPSFKPGEVVVVNLSSGLQAMDGTPLTPYAWQFHTAVMGGSGVFADTGQSLGDSNSRGMAMGNLDGDGDLDAFATNDNNQANRVWLNDGTGIFTATSQSLGNARSQTVALGDLDGDGDLDAFVANGHPGGEGNRVWLNDGTGVFTTTSQSLGDSASSAVSLGDLDGDGDLDAFIGNYGQGNRIWLNDGTGFFSDTGQSLGGSESQRVPLGDVDGDGDLDAFVANQGTNRVYLNDGAATFRDSGQSLGGSRSVGAALGDVDGDGDLDAFVANYDGQANRVWLNDGTGMFSDSGQSLGNSYGASVALGDVDGDGDLDAFVANDRSQANIVWANDGTGTFTETQGVGSSDSTDVALGDLDGDGDLDAFIANRAGSPENKVWLNEGQPAGVFLLPPTQSGQAVPGENAIYSEYVVNATGREDRFTLTLSGNTWSTTLAVTDTGLISDGVWFPLTVQVTVVVDAAWPYTDIVTIRATSVSSPSVYFDTAFVSTSVMRPVYHIYVPIVFKNESS